MLYLASRSPRRRALLQQAGIDFRLLDVSIHEEPLKHEAGQDFVCRMAREKAGAGLLDVSSVPEAVVLASDTEVVLNNTIFGKPNNQEEAASMLHQLSGQTHQVLTSICVMNAGDEQTVLKASTVRMSRIASHDLDFYLSSNEWQGKAGGYGIQGLAARFIEHIEGSYSAIMGLPIFETCQLLTRFGVPMNVLPASEGAV